MLKKALLGATIVGATLFALPAYAEASASEVHTNEENVVSGYINLDVETPTARATWSDISGSGRLGTLRGVWRVTTTGIPGNGRLTSETVGHGRAQSRAGAVNNQVTVHGPWRNTGLTSPATNARTLTGNRGVWSLRDM